MEALAKRLANSISVTLDYDEEKQAVITYGLFAIIQVFVTFILVLSVGLLFRVPVEALIICFSASILRKYSGGAHLNSAESCTVFSVITCSVFALLSRYVLLNYYNPLLSYGAIIIIYSIAFYIIYKFAPVDSPQKPIRTEQKKERMKYGSYITLSVFLIISLLLLYSNSKDINLKSYGISLLFGVSWQVFTLTDAGALFLVKINNILRKEVS